MYACVCVCLHTHHPRTRTTLTHTRTHRNSKGFALGEAAGLLVLETEVIHARSCSVYTC